MFSTPEIISKCAALRHTRFLQNRADFHLFGIRNGLRPFAAYYAALEIETISRLMHRIITSDTAASVRMSKVGEYARSQDLYNKEKEPYPVEGSGSVPSGRGVMLRVEPHRTIPTDYNYTQIYVFVNGIVGVLAKWFRPRSKQSSERKNKS